MREYGGGTGEYPGEQEVCNCPVWPGKIENYGSGRRPGDHDENASSRHLNVCMSDAGQGVKRVQSAWIGWRSRPRCRGSAPADSGGLPGAMHDAAGQERLDAGEPPKDLLRQVKHFLIEQGGEIRVVGVGPPALEHPHP